MINELRWLILSARGNKAAGFNWRPKDLYRYIRDRFIMIRGDGSV